MSTTAIALEQLYRLAETKRPANGEIADRTALEILGVRSLRAQGRCRGFENCIVVLLGGTSYSLVQTLLLYDVSLSHNAQCHKQTNITMPI